MLAWIMQGVDDAEGEGTEEPGSRGAKAQGYVNILAVDSRKSRFSRIVGAIVV